MIKQAIEALEKSHSSVCDFPCPGCYVSESLATLRAHQAELEQQGKGRPKLENFDTGSLNQTIKKYLLALESYCDTRAAERVEIVRKAREEGAFMILKRWNRDLFELEGQIPAMREAARKEVAAMPLEVKG